jgi:hypothetical protein
MNPISAGTVVALVAMVLAAFVHLKQTSNPGSIQ